MEKLYGWQGLLLPPRLASWWADVVFLFFCHPVTFTTSIIHLGSPTQLLFPSFCGANCAETQWEGAPALSRAFWLRGGGVGCGRICYQRWKLYSLFNRITDRGGKEGNRDTIPKWEGKQSGEGDCSRCSTVPCICSGVVRSQAVLSHFVFRANVRKNSLAVLWICSLIINAGLHFALWNETFNLVYFEKLTSSDVSSLW